VQSLAQGQQLISHVFSGGAASSIGTGTLNLSLGSQSLSVTIDSTNNTLAGIRDAINSAAGNPGISAALVYGTGNNAQLVLTSSRTGVANTITINSSGGDGGLSALNYSSGNTSNFTEQQAAQDATISIAGVTHTSSSNVVSDALDGVTLNLVTAKPNTNINLTVTNDSSHVTSLLQSFVTAYNTMIQQITPLGSYDASTKTAGPMLGDSLLTGIQNQLFHAMGDTVSNAGSVYNSLASLGVTTNADGTLSLDTNVLNSALNSNFQNVVSVMGGSGGVVDRLNSMLNTALSSAGIIQTRGNNLTTQQTSIDNENAAIAARTAVIQQRYMTQFNAMDTLLAQMQNTSSFLTQQFNALNKVNNSNG
jgi:flagellar hook-associated protein 2